MADFDAISEEDIDTISKAVGRWISTTPRWDRLIKLGQTASMGESIKVWSLSRKQIVETEARMREIATDTQRWHHQVFFDNTPLAFARTLLESDDKKQRDVSSWRMASMYEGELSSEIDQAISWIDANDVPDGTVRLVEIPSYHAAVFWVETGTEDLIVVVSMPSKLDKISTERIYKKNDFFALVSQYPDIVGAYSGRDNVPFA